MATHMKKTLLLVAGICLISACTTAHTQQTTSEAAQSSTTGVASTPTPTASPRQAVQTYGLPHNGKKMKLSQQPLEIRLFFAPEYNFIEDPKTGAYPNESPKWASVIKIEVKELDLNHDGVMERMIMFLTDFAGREINPETYDIYFFTYKQDEKKWVPLHDKSFSVSGIIRFVRSEKTSQFDEIRYRTTRYSKDQPDDEKGVQVISVIRMKDGKYEQVECRDPQSDEVIENCPPPLGYKM